MEIDWNIPQKVKHKTCGTIVQTTGVHVGNSFRGRCAHHETVKSLEGTVKKDWIKENYIALEPEKTVKSWVQQVMIVLMLKGFDLPEEKRNALNNLFREFSLKDMDPEIAANNIITLIG